MINHLKHMAIFARVIDKGSFRSAANSLNLSPSRVSETISDLENHLGVTLLYRTTRKIAITNEGKLLYARVIDMIQSAEKGIDELNNLLIEPVGNLNVSLPAFMTHSDISALLADFVRLHPKIKLSISYSDLPVGLLGDGFDVNIRLGWLEDSSMMSRKLGEQQRVLVVGANYAAARPKPNHPKDIESWDWIKYEHRAEKIEFISKQGETVKISGQHQLQVDNVNALSFFTSQNLGVTILPLALAEASLKSGEIIQLLPDWKLRPLGCFAVWADTSRRKNITLLLVRFLANKNETYPQA